MILLQRLSIFIYQYTSPFERKLGRLTFNSKKMADICLRFTHFINIAYHVIPSSGMDLPIPIIWAIPLRVLGAPGAILIFISFFDENRLSKQNSHRWDAAFGYVVCLCATKRTPGLNELIISVCSVILTEMYVCLYLQ